MGKNKSFRARSSPPAPRKSSAPGTQSTSPSLVSSILGNIATGFKLFDKPMPCITNRCVSSADSKIPKTKIV